MTLRTNFLATLLALTLTGCGQSSETPDGHDHDAGERHDDRAETGPARGSTADTDQAHEDQEHEDAGHDDPAGADAAHDDHGDDDHNDEARTTISADIAEATGIRVAPAGPGVIRDEHEVQGLLTPVEGRHARVVARFPGPVRAVGAGVGDTVRAGQRLATVESNISLSDYAIVAPLSGTVLSRNVAVGELAGEQPLFEIADLSTLWVDLHLFGADAQHITPGLPVEVVRLSDGVGARTTLDRVLPGTATASQSTVARATLENTDGRWRPGAAVRARVTVAEQKVALAVPLSALQRFRESEVVFVQSGDTYQARPLELGRRDGVNVEVLAGLAVGDKVVVEQSYLVKADIEKSGAAHDH